MSKFTSRQWLALAGFFLLFIVLFFINRKAPTPDNGSINLESAHVGNSMDFDQVIKTSEDSLPAADKQIVDKLIGQMDNASDSVKVRILAHLTQVFDSINLPVISAYYIEKLAAIGKSPIVWCKAGQKYIDFSGLGNSNLRDVLLKRAEMCFSNSLKLDSNNADATIGLGECQVDLGATPMEGIQTIMKVVRKDSNNRNAQIALGKLSIRSTQFEKAIYRFNRALAIDSSYKDAYVFLAEAYNGLGNKEQEVANLKKYRTFAPDSATRAEIDKIINHSEQNDTTK